MKLPFWNALAVVGLLVPVIASANAPAPPRKVMEPVLLTVDDNAKVFSESAIQRAKDTIKQVKSSFNEQVHIETTAVPLTDEEKTKLKENKDAFWKDWAKAKATGERGLIIGINMKPGHVEVLADRQIRNNGFTQDKEGYVVKVLARAFGKAQEAKSEEDALKIRDDALIEVAEYLRKNLPEGPAGKDKSK